MHSLDAPASLGSASNSIHKAIMGEIQRISESGVIRKNYMFIGTPGDHFPHRIEELGGVRVVL